MTTITPQRMVLLLVVGLLMLSGRPDSFVAAPVIQIADWVSPYTGPRRVDAIVGDTLTFNWPSGEIQNVVYHPSGTCDTTDAILLGPVGFTDGPVSFLFTDDGIGGRASIEIYFASDIGDHCTVGNQNIIVTLRRAPTPVPTLPPATLAPTPVPRTSRWLSCWINTRRS